MVSLQVADSIVTGDFEKVGLVRGRKYQGADWQLQGERGDGWRKRAGSGRL
jgi:hypothetical protein